MPDESGLGISAGASSRSAVMGAGCLSCRAARVTSVVCTAACYSRETNGTVDKYRAIDRKYCDPAGMSTPVLHSSAMCVAASAHIAVAGWAAQFGRSAKKTVK